MQDKTKQVGCNLILSEFVSANLTSTTNFNNGETMSEPTREEAVAELEERVRDTLYAEFAELGQLDLDVVNYMASRITNTILREGDQDQDRGVSDSEIKFEFFFIFEDFVKQIFVKPNE